MHDLQLTQFDGHSAEWSCFCSLSRTYFLLCYYVLHYCKAWCKLQCMRWIFTILNFASVCIAYKIWCNLRKLSNYLAIASCFEIWQNFNWKKSVSNLLKERLLLPIEMPFTFIHLLFLLVVKNGIRLSVQILPKSKIIKGKEVCNGGVACSLLGAIL